MSFTLQGIVALITSIASIIPLVSSIWETSGGFNKIAAVLNGLSSPALANLEVIGAQMFPNVAADVQKVLAAIHLGYPQATQWIQRALNAGETLGFISFGPQLAVDGQFGPKTMAAVVALQTKLGIKTTGAVTEAEYGALNLLIAGKLPTS